MYRRTIASRRLDSSAPSAETKRSRPGRGNQHKKGGIRPVSLSSELRGKQSAAGTHRKGRIAALIGIPFLSALAAAKSRGRGGCQQNQHVFSRTAGDAGPGAATEWSRGVPVSRGLVSCVSSPDTLPCQLR